MSTEDIITRAEQAYRDLDDYCRGENYRGWDPYDGLNSKVFRALGLHRSATLRLYWSQAFKRLPINLRPLAGVDKGLNPKGIALFVTAYAQEYLRRADGSLANDIERLGDLLISLATPGYSGACWGYNFDWQSRIFFQPAYTPTVVASSFAARALMDAYDVTGRARFLAAALSTTEFIKKDLNRTETDHGPILSYSPMDTSRVYNASLLGGFVLARGHGYSPNDEGVDLALRIARAVIASQHDDGSWVYGEAKVQGWVDSFHTGYNLDSLDAIRAITDDRQLAAAVDLGFKYYMAHFFETDGTPRYYNDRTYPIDIHCPAQLFVTLARLGQTEAYWDLGVRVLNWTLGHMADRRGFFYYQIKPAFSSRIPYMRWSQAFMLQGLSYFLSSANLIAKQQNH